MTESLLDKIAHSSNFSCITDKWKNGEAGEIIDIANDGNYRFVDYVIEDDDIKKRYISKEEEIQNCPVIATGIVGYWLHNRNKFAIKSLFESYYSLKMSQYEKEHENDNDAWNRDLKKEFALRYHIPTEKKAIHSSKAIFDFLPEEDIQKIENITKNYLQFIRFKRKILCLPQYPSNRVLEDTFFSAYNTGGGAHECVNWFRTEYDLPHMGNHWGSGKTEKSQLCGIRKVRHEVDIPAYIQEEYEDFDEKVLMYSNGGMMDEINENLKSCQTQEDRIRYIISLLQPFKSFADAFYPNTRINERKKAIEQNKKWRANYETIPEDTKNVRTGELIHPQKQIETINENIERYQKDIEYWKFVQDRFYWFAQHGLTGEFTKEESHDMCSYLSHWWSLMITFSRRLAALALTYGIKLMDIQEACGIYLNWQFTTTDYVDEKFVLSFKHAQKLLDEIDSKNANIETNKIDNMDKKKKDDNIQVLIEHHDNTNIDYYLSKKYWNYRVNGLLYKFLLTFYEDHEVADFLNPSRDRLLEANPDYRKLYGIFFNEAYALCKKVVIDEIPETKLSVYQKEASTWKFRSLNGKSIIPNAIDSIEGYHILCMAFSILSLLEDKTESTKRFISHLCIFDNEVYYIYRHNFKNYCINYQTLIFAILHERKDLGNNYGYDNVDKAMRHDFVWYARLFDNYERQHQKDDDNETNNSASTPIYISYNWHSGKLIAEQLCSALDKATIKYAIDKKDCSYRKDIREFENQLGSADMIIAIITNEYLRSMQCMRELALISKKGMIDKRLFPIVDLESRDVVAFAEHRKYWTDKLKEYETIDKSPGNDAPILEVKQDIDLIINEFSNIWSYIKNVNSPSREILFQDGCKVIIDEILKKTNLKK